MTVVVHDERRMVRVSKKSKQLVSAENRFATRAFGRSTKQWMAQLRVVVRLRGINV